MDNLDEDEEGEEEDLDDEDEENDEDEDEGGAVGVRYAILAMKYSTDAVIRAGPGNVLDVTHEISLSISRPK